MIGGVAAIAGSAAGTALLPIIACSAVGALVVGGLSWAIYRGVRKLRS
jgi:hypothetical protein